MAELADALDLGSSETFRAGSSPVTRTKKRKDTFSGVLSFSLCTKRREPRKGNAFSQVLRVHTFAKHTSSAKPRFKLLLPAPKTKDSHTGILCCFVLTNRIEPRELSHTVRKSTELRVHTAALYALHRNSRSSPVTRTVNKAPKTIFLNVISLKLLHKKHLAIRQGAEIISVFL